MRCLGIPNTAHFANVTQIEDALACKLCLCYLDLSMNATNSCKVFNLNVFKLTVWDKIRNQKTAERWQPEVEEEFEDSMGNVVNKKTFEDLKRQGLL